jgi:hypothetical protein
MNARDNAIWGGSQTSADKMREESGVDSSMGKVSFGGEFFFLSLMFLQI